MSKFISGTYTTIAAGAIESIEKTTNGRAVIVLAAANDKIIDNMKVTFAGATVETGLNDTSRFIR